MRDVHDPAMQHETLSRTPVDACTSDRVGPEVAIMHLNLLEPGS